MAQHKAKVELRNFQHNARMSEETDCFSATIYIDGVKVAEVSNRGHGGCNEYQPWSITDRLEDIALAQLPADETDFEAADALIGHLVQRQLIRKDAVRFIRTRLNYQKEVDGPVYQSKTYKPEQINAWTTPAKLASTMAAIKAVKLFSDVDDLTEVMAKQAHAAMVARRTSSS